MDANTQEIIKQVLLILLLALVVPALLIINCTFHIIPSTPCYFGF